MTQPPYSTRRNLSGSGLRSKKNPLEEEIIKLNTEIMHYGGYYYLPDVKESEFSNEFLDVYLLASSIKNQEIAKKIKLVHDLHK